MINKNTYQLLIQILDVLLIIIGIIMTISAVMVVSIWCKYIDQAWVQKSYFSHIIKFNWWKFFTQFSLLQIIFLIIFIGLTYLPISFQEKIPKSIKKLFKPFTVLYFSTTLTISLSITMTETVFVTMTSIIAFIALIYPLVKRIKFF
ncbi:hypothetical protein [uncultured Streptococcus sp.]|uniref:hypothetical protein n=1 Tax=uncultured Streptococcus sp. TaxID=83427 RepID=UPI00280C2B3C|nr:hypothetical protein [uncultured Streptococcus sp.]